MNPLPGRPVAHGLGCDKVMIVLFTVLYGRNPLYDLELFGSLYSALLNRRGCAVQIVVFTDREAIANLPFPIKVIKITEEDWDLWTRKGELKHLIKMHTMIKMLDTYRCPVIYFDTDVIFRVPLRIIASKITRKTTLMHACEGAARRQAPWKNLVAGLPRSEVSLSEPVAVDSEMFNSGIVGLLPEHRPLMEKALRLAEELYQYKAIFNIEQFATGRVLSEYTKLVTCEREVLHYWGWRRRFAHIALDELRSGAGDADVEPAAFDYLLGEFPPIDIRDKIAAFMRYPPLIGGRNGRFSYLAYRSGVRLAEKPLLANAWLATCLDNICKRLAAGGDSGVDRRDIEYLLPCLAAPPSWIDHANAGALDDLRSRLLERQILTAG